MADNEIPAKVLGFTEHFRQIKCYGFYAQQAKVSFSIHPEKMVNTPLVI